LEGGGIDMVCDGDGPNITFTDEFDGGAVMIDISSDDECDCIDML
jgi:hypothetical protein